MMDDNITLKRKDQIHLLECCKEFTDTGKSKWCFAYPKCDYDLVQLGLVTESKQITHAGRVALWLLGKGPDLTSSKAIETLSLGTGR